MAYSYKIETTDEARARHFEGKDSFDQLGSEGFCAFIPISKNRYGVLVFEITHDSPLVFREEMIGVLNDLDLFDADLVDYPSVPAHEWPHKMLPVLLGKRVEVIMY